MTPLPEIGERIAGLPGLTLPPAAIAGELLRLAEQVIEHWLLAQGAMPTDEAHEGFRLLGLHRQGARLDPSFNACRESCRELVYHYNLIALAPDDPRTGHWLRMAGAVAMHIHLFVGGKLEVAGLGEFCCSSRPLRAAHQET